MPSFICDPRKYVRRKGPYAQLRLRCTGEPGAHRCFLSTTKRRARGPGQLSQALLPSIVRLFLGSPYLAVHPLEKRLAPLVELLVIANQLELVHGKVVEALGNLIHVLLVVALYGEGDRLRSPFDALGRSTHGAGRDVCHGAGRGSEQAARGLSSRHRSFLDCLRRSLGTRPVAA